MRPVDSSTHGDNNEPRTRRRKAPSFLTPRQELLRAAERAGFLVLGDYIGILGTNVQLEIEVNPGWLGITVLNGDFGVLERRAKQLCPGILQGIFQQALGAPQNHTAECYRAAIDNMWAARAKAIKRAYRAGDVPMVIGVLSMIRSIAGS